MGLFYIEESLTCAGTAAIGASDGNAKWQGHCYGTARLSAVQRQTAVTAYLKSKQLLLFVFALNKPAVQAQTALIDYLESEPLLLFVFARIHYHDLYVYVYIREVAADHACYL